MRLTYPPAFGFETKNCYWSQEKIGTRNFFLKVVSYIPVISMIQAIALQRMMMKEVPKRRWCSSTPLLRHTVRNMMCFLQLGALLFVIDAITTIAREIIHSNFGFPKYN